MRKQKKETGVHFLSKSHTNSDLRVQVIEKVELNQLSLLNYQNALISFSEIICNKSILTPKTLQIIYIMNQ